MDARERAGTGALLLYAGVAGGLAEHPALSNEDDMTVRAKVANFRYFDNIWLNQSKQLNLDVQFGSLTWENKSVPRNLETPTTFSVPSPGQYRSVLVVSSSDIIPSGLRS